MSGDQISSGSNGFATEAQMQLNNFWGKALEDVKTLKPVCHYTNF